MEIASTHAAVMIETLLNVHALACYWRANGNDEHRKSAAQWLPHLERQLASLRDALEPKTGE